jgi:hypothetical protein
MKKCPKCENEKDDSEFRISKHGKPYGRCLPCRQIDHAIRMQDPINYFKGILSTSRKHKGKKSLRPEDLITLWKLQNGKCAITGLPMSLIRGAGQRYNNASLDRIDPKLPYEVGNIWLVLNAINTMKGQLQLNELVAFCRLIAQRDDQGLLTR